MTFPFCRGCIRVTPEPPLAFSTQKTTTQNKTKQKNTLEEKPTLTERLISDFYNQFTSSLVFEQFFEIFY